MYSILPSPTLAKSLFQVIKKIKPFQKKEKSKTKKILSTKNVFLISA